MNVTRNLAVVRYDKCKTNSFYLKEYLLTQEAQISMIGSSNQSTLKQLPLGKLKQLLIPLPNIEEQDKFGEFVKQIDKLKFEVMMYLDI